MTTGFTQTRLTELLGIRYPIVQAPMASISTAPLVSAVSESGALGSLGSALFRSSELQAHVERVRERTERPFAVNFYVHEAPRSDRAALASTSAATLRLSGTFAASAASTA